MKRANFQRLTESWLNLWNASTCSVVNERLLGVLYLQILTCLMWQDELSLMHRYWYVISLITVWPSTVELSLKWVNFQWVNETSLNFQWLAETSVNFQWNILCRFSDSLTLQSIFSESLKLHATFSETRELSVSHWNFIQLSVTRVDFQWLTDQVDWTC